MKLHIAFIVFLLAVSLSWSACTTSKQATNSKVRMIEEPNREYRFKLTKVKSFSRENPYLKVRLKKVEINSTVIEKEYIEVRALNELGWLLSLGTAAGFAATGIVLRNEGFVVAGRYLFGMSALIAPSAYVIARDRKRPQWEKKREEIPTGREFPEQNTSVEVRLKESKSAYDSYVTNEDGEFEIDVMKYWLEKGQSTKIVQLEARLPEKVGLIEPIMVSDTLLLAEIEQHLLGPKNKTQLSSSPYSLAQISLTPRDGRARAGDEIGITVSIRNTGKGPYSRLIGTIRCKEKVLDGRNFYFGEISPNQEKSRSIKMKIPTTFAGGDLPVEIHFQEQNSYEPEPLRYSFDIEELPKPNLEYTYQVIDDGTGKSVGNGDGKIQKGETIDLIIRILNSGKIDARNVRVGISSAISEGLKLIETQMQIEVIGIDESANARLTFSINNVFKRQQIPMMLNISEAYVGINIEQNLPLPLEEKIEKIISLRKFLVVTTSVADIYGGSAENIPKIAKVKKNDYLQAIAKSNDWYQIEWGEGKKGWIRERDVAIVSAQTEQRSPSSIIPPIVIAGPSEIFDLPPVVALFSPQTDSLTIPSSTFDVAGIALDNKKLDSLIIKIDGIIQFMMGRHEINSSAELERSGQHKLKFTKTFELEVGPHEISVVAYDERQASEPIKISVTRTRAIPNIWAAIIGISEYENKKEVRQLRFADRDAESIYRYLIDSLRIAEGQIFLLKNEKATLTNIRNLLGEKLRQRVRNEDQVIIYFSGHGAIEPDPTSLDGDGLSKYLLPYDAKLDHFYSTALPMDEMARIFHRIQAGTLVYIGDTCYSGAFGSETETSLGKFIRPRSTTSDLSNISYAFINRIAERKGRFILASSRPNEISVERPDLEHGVFTYCLLNALKGAADENQDGFVTILETYRYLQKEVPDLTNNSQHPVLEMRGEDTIIGRARGGK
ncbi:MAG: hypothetical protein DKINENOH_05389 [bacterium]|nr:hypothetical protein [bacterium]